MREAAGAEPASPTDLLMRKISFKTIQLCRRFRKQGFSHRDISQKLNIGLGTAYKYTKNIKISHELHLKLKRRKVYKFKPDQCKKGGLHCPNKFQPKYTKDNLINFIQGFVKKKGRIPTKREVTSHHPYVRIFGSWNKAIKSAGFEPNPVMFAKKHWAFDGHRCDSFAEFVIDNWLYLNKIPHQIHVLYPNSKMSSDFLINDMRVEFIGLQGEVKKYDKLLRKKRKIAKEHNLDVVEIFPKDLFPKNKLSIILKKLLSNSLSTS